VQKCVVKFVKAVFVIVVVAGCGRIKQAEKQYMDAFNDELESFKDRIRRRAQAKIEDAMRQVEEVSPETLFLFSLFSQYICRLLQTSFSRLRQDLCPSEISRSLLPPRNSGTLYLTTSPSFSVFRHKLKKFLFQKSYPDIIL